MSQPISLPDSISTFVPVSVIIPTYRRELQLCITLETLLCQNYPNFEIIVVDQTDTHDVATEQFLAKNGSRIHLIHSSPPSVTRARSLGALAATGEIVLYIDDDVICAPDLILNHVRAHQIPGVAVVAGRMTDNETHAIDETQVGRLFTNGQLNAYFSSTIRQIVDHVPGANMSYKKEILIRAGLFEPEMNGTARFEELDASIRVGRLGYKILFEPTARIHHFGGPGGQSFGVGFDRSYRTVVHNGLLFIWRNMRVIHWPSAFIYRFRNAFFLTRKYRNILPTRIFVEEFLRSIGSYFRSRNSLPPGAPRWPLKK